MLLRRFALLWLGLVLLVAPACGGASSAASADGGASVDGGASADGGAVADGGALADAGPPDGGVGTPKAANCASTFGNEITASFGRIDGVVRAVVTPTDGQCALPNNDHLVVQVDMHGATYRMVVNVRSDRAGVDPRVHLAEKQAALPGSAWAEGWHAGETLDYVADLGLHAADFTPYEMNPLVARVAERINVGERISIYAGTTNDRTASAHLVHRNGNHTDGAIVVGVGGASPTVLAFRFANQSF